MPRPSAQIKFLSRRFFCPIVRDKNFVQGEKDSFSLSKYFQNGGFPWCGEIGMGFSPLSGEATKVGKKISHESRKAHFIFPMNGLAGMVKINFPMSGGATNGEIYFYHDC